MATRWGICSTGFISGDFAGAMKILPFEEHKIVAVAERSGSTNKADRFAEKYSIPRAYGSYEDLAQDPEVDIVYIGTIHTQHHRLSLMFLEAGKHVLCEKPLCLSLQGCEDVLNKAKEKNLFFMEGVWSRFFPVYDQIRKELTNGSLGEVKLVQAKFCLRQYEVERIHNKALGGGALMDIGEYPIMAANLVFRGRPEKIVAEAEITEDGVDSGGVVTLTYPGGQLASLVYHVQVGSDDNSLSIMGTEGSIHVESTFTNPTKIRTPTGDYEFPLPPNDYAFHFKNNHGGLVYEQLAVRECLKKGLMESPLMSHEDSRTIAYIMEEIRRQIGINYAFP